MLVRAASPLLAFALLVGAWLATAPPSESALTFTLSATVQTGTNAAGFTTSSFTRTSGVLFVAFAAAHNNSSGWFTPPSVTASGYGPPLYWTMLDERQAEGTGNDTRIGAWCMVGDGVTGTVSFDYPVTISAFTAHVIKVEGSNVTGTTCGGAVRQLVGSAPGLSGTSGSLTLTALGDVNNSTLGWFYHQANETSTAGAGYTSLGTGGATAPGIGQISEYSAPGATSVAASWATSALWGGYALELEGPPSTPTATPTGTGTPTPTGTPTGEAPMTAEQGETLISLVTELNTFGSTWDPAINMGFVVLLLGTAFTFALLCAFLVAGRSHA